MSCINPALTTEELLHEARAVRREAATTRVSRMLAGIEGLEISEVTVEAYLAALREWEQSLGSHGWPGGRL